jgi:hypothetical protein
MARVFQLPGLAHRLMVSAASPPPAPVEALQCLTDGPSHKLAQKLYKQYVSDEDYSKFHSFLVDLDRMLVRHGAKVNKQPVEEGYSPLRVIEDVYREHVSRNSVGGSGDVRDVADAEVENPHPAVVLEEHRTDSHNSVP